MVQLVQHLIGPTCFPTPMDAASHLSLSIMSYNVLLPNSIDGWWNYKMYSPPLPEENMHWSTWEYRRDLLKQRIELVNADVVCLQEVAPESFEDDFAFMADLGYEHEMFKKGRFRPATFWKSDRLDLVAPPVHKDRTLLTAVQIRDDRSSKGDSIPQSKDKTWYILNCHLQAGKEGKRRVRQMIEGVGAVVNLAKKRKELKPENIPVIICGDFNGGSECGAIRLLEDGGLDETFLEDGEPVVSSRKELRLIKPLIDVMASVDREPPATLSVSELISSMVAPGTTSVYENPRLSAEMKARLERIYDRLASDLTPKGQRVMGVSDVEAWLIKINGQVGRGSEFREAAKQMGWKEDTMDSQEGKGNPKTRIKLPANSSLSLESFMKVYEAELRQGKFWGIAYDMAVLGEPLPDAGVFQARYDRIYCSSVIQATAVMDFRCTVPCPNGDEPSDHLPVAAQLSMMTH